MPYDDFEVQGQIGMGPLDPNTYLSEDWADTGIGGSGAGTSANLESATAPMLAPPPPGYGGGRLLGEPSPAAAQAMIALQAGLQQSQAAPNRVPGDVSIQRSMGFGAPLSALNEGFDQYSRGEFGWTPTFPTPPGTGSNLSTFDKVGLQGAKAITNLAPNPTANQVVTNLSQGARRQTARAQPMPGNPQAPRQTATQYFPDRPPIKPTPAPKPKPAPVQTSPPPRNTGPAWEYQGIRTSSGNTNAGGIRNTSATNAVRNTSKRF